MREHYLFLIYQSANFQTLLVFRQVLSKFGLHLKDDNALNSLLSRCGILEPGDVNYKMFLARFQDRSDQGTEI